MTNTTLERICCRCNRKIDLNELLVNEGRSYHGHCHLETVRTRISVLDNKAQRGTLTILDAKELDDLRFLESVGKKDILTGSPKVRLYDPDKPRFSGNTPMGLRSAYNPSRKQLAELQELRRRKAGGWKDEPSVKETRPEEAFQFKIMTDEDGHKYCIQIGTLPVEEKKKLLDDRGSPVLLERAQ